MNISKDKAISELEKQKVDAVIEFRKWKNESSIRRQ